MMPHPLFVVYGESIKSTCEKRVVNIIQCREKNIQIKTPFDKLINTFEHTVAVELISTP